VPGGFGSYSQKANAHFYSKETVEYVQTKPAKTVIENLASNFAYSEPWKTFIEAVSQVCFGQSSKVRDRDL
jgi:hypothetical protein